MSGNTKAFHEIPKESRIVLQYDKQMNLVKEWTSIRKILDKNPYYCETTLIGNLSGFNKSAYEYIWKYKIPREKKIPNNKVLILIKNN